MGTPVLRQFSDELRQTFTGQIQDFDQDDNTLTVKGDQGTRKFNLGEKVTVRYRDNDGQRQLVALTRASQGESSGTVGSYQLGQAQSSSSTMSYQGEVRKVDKRGTRELVSFT